MGDFQIVCKIHDENEVITHVGIGKDKYAVKIVVDWINEGTHTFYTLEDGKRAKVYARQRSDTGTWFLTTNPDSDDVNNLDFLPAC